MTAETVGNCPFCNSSEVILENAQAQVILSNPRKVPGHVLVMPKRHVEQPWDITAEELQAVYELIFAIEPKLLAAGLGDGVDVRQNYRPYLKQNQLKVDHMHFHMIPRSLEDYIYSVSEKYEKELFADLDDAERDEVAKILTD